jgi:hypothetical protein
MAAEKRKSVCILGTASTMKEAPFEDEDCEMWGVSSLTENPECKRLDRTFELHPRRYFGQLPVMVRLSKHKGPIYMQDHYDDIPNSVAYPRDEVKTKFHIDAMGDNLFVTNTITWMILLALHEGFQDISLFGVHMAHDTEYRYQAPSCSWALGIIQGLIIAGEPYTLHIAEESELLKARYEYGFDEPSELMLETDTRRKRLLAGVEDADKRLKALELSKARTEGAAQEATYWHNYISGYR